MNRKSVLMCVLTLLTVAYIAFAVPLTLRMAAADRLTDLEIILSDPTNRFITGADIARECNLNRDSLRRVLRKDFDLYSLARRLESSDKIERADVNLLTDGCLRLRVVPMEPVARVFENGRPSYYINTSGKKISAELRYHLDVPVIIGSFDSIHTPERLLPLLDYIAANPADGSLVASVCQERDGDIIIVPTVVGHVVNFGDTSMVADKFRRLRSFYHQVLATSGWTRYDTLSVKWRGQLVATLRDKAPAKPNLITVEEQSGALDEVPLSVMAVPDTTELVSGAD